MLRSFEPPSRWTLWNGSQVEFPEVSLGLQGLAPFTRGAFIQGEDFWKVPLGRAHEKRLQQSCEHFFQVPLPFSLETELHQILSLLLGEVICGTWRCQIFQDQGHIHRVMTAEVRNILGKESRALRPLPGRLGELDPQWKLPLYARRIHDLKSQGCEILYCGPRGELWDTTYSNIFAVDQGVFVFPQEPTLFRGLTEKEMIFFLEQTRHPWKYGPLWDKDLSNYEAFGTLNALGLRQAFVQNELMKKPSPEILEILEGFQNHYWTKTCLRIMK